MRIGGPDPEMVKNLKAKLNASGTLSDAVESAKFPNALPFVTFGEITGRSFSIDQWCEMHGLSRSFFYKLKTQGKAPRSFKIGSATRISEDANNKWLAELEAVKT